MHARIVVAIAMDQIEAGEAALVRAKAMLDAGGEISLLNVVEDMQAYAQGYMIVDFPFQMMEAARAHALRVMTDFKAKNSVTGRVELRTGGAAGTINAFAAEEKADLLLISSHRPGLIDYVLGSTAARVVSHCPCSVLVVR